MAEAFYSIVLDHPAEAVWADDPAVRPLRLGGRRRRPETIDRDGKA